MSVPSKRIFKLPKAGTQHPLGILLFRSEMIPEFADQPFLLDGKFRGVRRPFKGLNGLAALSVLCKGLAEIEETCPGRLVLLFRYGHKSTKCGNLAGVVSGGIGCPCQEKQGLCVRESGGKVPGPCK